MQDKILGNTSDPVVAGLPHEHLLALWRRVQQMPGLDPYSADGLLRWRTGIPDGFFNGVLAERPARADESAVIQEAIAYFRSEKVPAMNWWLPSKLENSGWDAQLRAQGFSFEDHTPGMVIDMAHLSALRLPREARIVRVTSQAENRVWTETLCRGYGVPVEYLPILQYIGEQCGYEIPFHNFLAYWGEQPAATSALFLALGAAGIYNVATLEEFRGRGLGTAVTLSALLDAYALDYRVGVLQASPMGLPIYQKMGFMTTCAVRCYARALAEG
jgi:GNAT superfamily N-acetyltransferase